MPVYILTPINLSEEDWDFSSHRGHCRIHAAAEDKAREYAGNQFFNGITATVRRPVSASLVAPVASNITGNPWTNPGIVVVRELTNFTPEHYSEGKIEIPDESRSFDSIDDVTNIDDLADFDGLTPYRVINKGHGQTGGEWDEATWDKAEWGDEHIPPPNDRDLADKEPLIDSTQNSYFLDGQSSQVVESQITPIGNLKPFIQANKTSLRIQAKTLLQLIDEFQNHGSSSNIVPPQLWVPANDDENENLTRILVKLRDELRSFNDMLASDELPEKNVVGNVISTFGGAGKRFIDAFAITAGTGTGIIFISALGHYMADLGLVPWERIMEVMEKMSKD